MFFPKLNWRFTKSNFFSQQASDWLHEYRNDNNPRRIRIKRQTNGACWPTLVALLTQPDSSPSEQLFAAQSLLYRVRRLELADALDIDDPWVLALPPSSSLKASDEAIAAANAQALSQISALSLAACAGNASKPILRHLCLTQVTVAVRVATRCSSDQEAATCDDLVSIVAGALQVVFWVFCPP